MTQQMARLKALNLAVFLFLLASNPSNGQKLLHSVHRASTRASARHNVDAPVATASKNSPLDPSNFLVVLIAAIILIYGANRALRPPFVDMGGTSGEASAYEEAQEAGTFRTPRSNSFCTTRDHCLHSVLAGEMKLHTTFMFVIVSSCSLVLIFYFMSGTHSLPRAVPRRRADTLVWQQCRCSSQFSFH